MSREVDQRVVQMQFDNAQFERGTRQSLGTIEALKKSLNFDSIETKLSGFSKSINKLDFSRLSDSLNGISKSAKKIDFSPVSDGVDTVSFKLSALSVVAGTVLAGLTNKILAVSGTVAAAFSVEPMLSGLSEYETQINAIQTILSNTKSKGTTLDQVNEALDELNHYADLTIYNFTEMTRNIGTFTAAGVGLEQSVAAIKGIANLGAMSGSQPYQVANAMYQLSQALATGTIRLMDWNSVVTAGMGGEVFRDAILETARVHGVAVDEIIAKQGSFRDSLQKGWLTSAILLETLQKFSGDLSEEELKAIGYTEEQIDAIIQLGQDAQDAATKVKTFTQLIDTLKEANQSGWTQSWEYIFGDFEEAKTFWTEMSDIFSGFINESANARNELLKGGMTSGWSQLIDKGITDSAALMESVLKRIGIQSGRVTAEQINAAGGFEASLKSGWATSEMIQQSINEIIDQTDDMLNLSDEQIEKYGVTRDKLLELSNSYKSLNQQIAKGKIDLDEYTGLMRLDSGRDNLIESVRNVISAVKSISSPIKQAFADIFPSATSDTVRGITERIREITGNLRISNQTAEKLRSTFSGIFAVVKLVVDAGKTVGSGIGRIAVALSPLLGGILNVTSAIGNFLVSLESAISQSGLFKTVSNGLGFVLDFVTNGINDIAGAFQAFSTKTEIIIAPLSGLNDLLTTIGGGVVAVAGYLHDLLLPELYDLSQSALNALKHGTMMDLYDNLNAGILAGLLVSIKGLVNGMKEFLKTQGGFFGVIGTFKSALKSIGSAFSEWEKYNIKTGYIQAIAKSIALLAGSLVVLSLIKPERLLSSVMALTVLFAELGIAFNYLSGFKIKGTASMLGLSAALLPISTAVLELSVALNVVAMADIDGMLVGIAGIGLILAELSATMAIVSKIKATRLVKGASTILVMATAVTVMSSSVGKLGALDLPTLAKGLASVGLILTEISVFMLALSKIGTKSKSFNLSGFNSMSVQFAGMTVALLGITASVAALSSVVKKLGSLNTDVLIKGVASIGALLVEMSVFAAALAVVGKMSGKSGFSKLGKTMISAAASFTIIAAAINILLGPIEALGKMQLTELGVALGSIALVLGEFVVALNLVSADEVLRKAASISAIAISMSMLSGFTLDFNNLLAIAGALGAISAVLIVLSSNKLVTKNILSIATGIAILSTGIGTLLFLLNTSDLPGSMADIFAPFEKAGWESMLGFAVEALRLIPRVLIMIVEEFGNAAAQLVTSIANIITAIALGIAQAAPAIGQAVAAIIVAVAYVIQETATVIAGAIAALFKALWPYVEEGLDWIFSNLQIALDEHFSELVFGFEKTGSGLLGFLDRLGPTIRGDSEALGEDVVAGYSKAFDEDKTAGDAIETFFERCRFLWLSLWGIASPSKVAAEDGKYVPLGYAEGIQNGIPAVNAAMLQLASSADATYRNYWGIHSNADLGIEEGEYTGGGLAEGLINSTGEVADATNTVADTVLNTFIQSNLENKVYGIGAGISQSFMNGLVSKLDFAKANAGNPLVNPDYVGEELYNRYIKNGAKEAIDKGLITNIGNELKTWVSDTFGMGGDALGDGLDAVTSGSSSGSGTKKTLGEQIAEKYEKQIELNETLQKIAEQEHELWLTENENTADSDAIIAKKLEYTTNQIAIQTDRVAIAQQKYDDMYSQLGQDAQDTKDAYLELLEAQNQLAQLRSEQYNDLYEASNTRLSTQADRFDKEYNLWLEQNDNATEVAKSNRKIENATNQLSVSTEKVENALKQYQTMRENLGEEDLRTQEAYNDWLEAQIDMEEKRNELFKAQLEQYDNALTLIDRKSDLFTARSDLLSKIYDDGDLSTRSDDYISAVETYGKDSPEALRAKYQGSANGVLGVATALRNMADELKRTSVYQARYEALMSSSEATAEDLANAQNDIISSQASFVDFASDFADAFNMTDEGKDITVRLAYAISQNWDTIYGGLEQAWGKVKDKIPQLASGLEKIFGVAFSDTGIELSTSLTSTVVSALSGDYASALASGLNTIITFAGSEMGQNLISSITQVVATGLPEIGAKIAGFVGSSGVLTTIGETLGGIVSTVAGSGGVAAALGSIPEVLAAIGAAIPELLPIIAIIGAIGAAVGFLITNWDNLGDIFNNVVDSFVNFGKNIAEGLINGVKSVWNGVTGFFKSIFGGLLDIVSGIFGINSPSIVMAKFGEFIDEGFAGGIDKSSDKVSNSMERMSNKALDTARNVTGLIQDALRTDSPYQPTITPIVDLTSAKDSSNWVRANYTAYKDFSLNATRTARLAIESDTKRNQNGKSDKDSSRSDVVAAIDSLGNRVSMMGQSIENMKIVMDTGKLVGSIAGPMDTELGRRGTRARRGG